MQDSNGNKLGVKSFPSTYHFNNDFSNNKPEEVINGKIYIFDETDPNYATYKQQLSNFKPYNGTTEVNIANHIVA